MHRLELSAWITRLRHLLAVERYGFSSVRFPGDIPAAARSRSARHLALGGPGMIDALADAWPAIEAFPIWPDFRRALIRGRSLGPAPGPMSRRGFIGSPATSRDDPLDQVRRLLGRLAYLHDEEELQEGAFGLLTLSEAWRSCLHDLTNPFGDLLEAFLDTRSATERRVVRFWLRNFRIIDEWQNIPDRELFASFAAAMERQPDSLACAPAKQIERLRRAGALCPDFALRKAEPDDDLDDECQPQPLARVPSGHFDLQPVHELALITMSPLLEPRAHE